MNFKTLLETADRTRNGMTRRELAQASKNLYVSNLNSLKKILQEKKDEPIQNEVEELLPDFVDFDKMKELLEDKMPNPLSRKTYFSAIITVLETMEKDNQMVKDSLSKYEKERVAIDLVYKKERMEGKLHKKQKENCCSKKDIEDLLNRLNQELKVKEDKDKFTFFILLKTYLTYPMRNELATIKLVDIMDFTENEDEKYNKGNWLVRMTKATAKYPYFKFVFNEYKTDKTYGQRQMDLPLALRKIYHTYITTYNILEDSQIYTLKSGKDMTQLNLTKFLTRHFQKYLNKNISTTLLRKIYYGSKYDKETLQNLSEDAANAGHSPATAMSIYVSKEIPQS